MIYLGDKAVGITNRFLLNWDKVAEGTEDLSMFDNILLSNNIITDYAFSGIPIKQISGENISSIGKQSFSYCRKLMQANFPNVETIGQEAFRYSTLTTVPHLLNLHTIGDNGFRDCLIEYLIAPQLINIGKDCFYSSSNLKCVDLGNKKIQEGFVNNDYCFEFNSNCIVVLRYGYVLDAQAKWFYNNYWMQNSRAPGKLYVYANLIEGYQNHPIWGPLLTSNNNQILSIEGSIYETQYGDGTLIT